MLAPGESAPDIDPAGLDEDALKVIRGLRAEGFQAYMVGGCVRDLLLGRHAPKDFDIATSAHPWARCARCSCNCRLIGRRASALAHVYFRSGKIIEVATFRKNPAARQRGECRGRGGGRRLAAGEFARQRRRRRSAGRGDQRSDARTC